MNLDDDLERSASAGEYVLGTLIGGERAAFEQALADEPALQAEVYAWQDRLLSLTGRATAVEPEPRLWSRIEAGLAKAGAVSAAATDGAAAARPAALRPTPLAPSAMPAAPSRAAANDPLWQRLRRWQGVSGVAIAAVLVLATLLLLRPPVTPTDRYLALLQAPDRSTGWVVEGEPGGRIHLVPIGEAAPVPAGKTLQFWTKPEGAAKPTSLGLVRPGTSVEVAASRLPGLGEKQLFELTLEPEGGSPIGRPTGPILYVGRAVRI